MSCVHARELSCKTEQVEGMNMTCLCVEKSGKLALCEVYRVLIQVIKEQKFRELLEADMPFGHEDRAKWSITRLPHPTIQLMLFTPHQTTPQKPVRTGMAELQHLTYLKDSQLVPYGL